MIFFGVLHTPWLAKGRVFGGMSRPWMAMLGRMVPMLVAQRFPKKSTINKISLKIPISFKSHQYMNHQYQSFLWIFQHWPEKSCSKQRGQPRKSPQWNGQHEPKGILIILDYDFGQHNFGSTSYFSPFWADVILFSIGVESIKPGDFPVHMSYFWCTWTTVAIEISRCHGPWALRLNRKWRSWSFRLILLAERIWDHTNTYIVE